MAEGKQVLVKLVTKLPQQLRVPETPIAVPASLKRHGLSQIINHLLALDPSRPFDFIINGELLRQTLEGHLMHHGLSAESLLEVEYVPAVVPPKLDKSSPHDDWVSDVDASWGSSHVVSASYDGRIRVWHLKGSGSECVASWHAHDDGVNSVVSGPKGSSGADQLLYSGGKDRAVLMWRVTDGEQQLLASFSGHTDAVESVTVSPSGKLLASCGWDGQLLTWKAGQEVVDAAAEAAAANPTPAASKRRKGASKDSTTISPSAPEGGLPQTPLSTLQGPGHVHCVAGVAWASEGVLFSGGWDHTVRRWDVGTGVNTDTYNGSKAVCCVATSPNKNVSLVAFGCSDKVLRLWDSRTHVGGEAVAVQSRPSHAGMVVDVSWCPESEHLLATASHDHTVKLWDTRSSVPLATLAEHQDKALCVSWITRTSLCSGGADCKLLTYHTTQ